MFTLFDLFSLTGLFCGLMYGFHLGHHYGLVGSLAGALIDGFLGFVIGKIPWWLSIWLIFCQLRKKSTAELWSGLQDDANFMPNMVLRELKRRGEPMPKGLDLVLAMLESEARPQRLIGFAAFLSNFPELSEKMPSYRPDLADAERREALGGLRSFLGSADR